MPKNAKQNRRDFIKTTGKVTAASALAGVALPHVHANMDDTVKVALIGAGGRGTGAAHNALSVSAANGPTKLVAMADVFENKMKSSFNSISKKHGKEKVALGKTQANGLPEKGYIGFDGYKHAMDQLSPGDIAIFTTPPGFRWVFFDYAVKKGLNVFMEKPVTADGYGTQKILEINKTAKKKNLKVGVGLMCRHSRARREMTSRITNGELGELLLLRSYRMHGPVASAHSLPRKQTDPNLEEVRWQIKRFHSFLWASGGLFNDYYIHTIDECCWMKGAELGDPDNEKQTSWPLYAQATGGRHYRDENVDQNFDSYSVEYTFSDGTKLWHNGRTINGCHNEFASYAHGTKGLGIFSINGHWPADAQIFKNQTPNPANRTWSFNKRVGGKLIKETNPYQDEWDDLLDAIRNNKPYNEADRGARASQTCNMGRMAAHTGQRITWDQSMNAEPFAPNLDKLAGLDSKAPVTADKDGKYPVPMPGIIKDKEY